jgi:hypothetical protein
MTYLPVLPTLRELYLQPRDVRRFHTYIATLTGGTGDIVLPIGVANPMAKEHAVAKIDELLAMGADEIAAEATTSAQARLARVQLKVEIKASLVLVDDAGGGWTNRFTTEVSVRFPRRGALKRPFATALAWTSEAVPTSAQIRQEMLAAIYRVAHQQRHGLPTTLAAMLEQEGLAGVFAGAQPALRGDELAAARAIIAAQGADPPYPQAFACLYGDAAAEAVGYPRLGLPPRAGFLIAVADALERGVDAVAVLGFKP